MMYCFLLHLTSQTFVFNLHPMHQSIPGGETSHYHSPPKTNHLSRDLNLPSFSQITFPPNLIFISILDCV
eukprot:c49859_g1_i1 orf=63-272(-)